VRPDELVAAALLAELLHAVALPHDGPGQGDGRYDWDLRCRDGRRVALEVTMHSDSDMLAFWRKGDHYREIPGLGSTYLVNVNPAASRNSLWKQLPRLLPEFADGFVDVEYIRWNRADPRREAAETLATLGVRRVSFAPEPAQSAITFTTSSGGAVAASVAVDGAMSELEPNRAKLAAAVGVDERHLFVWVDGSAGLASMSLRDAGAPPSDLVELGDGIDVLWVAAVDASRRPISASVLWRASGRHWEDWTSRVTSRTSIPS
jgi:hypothetical protein